jgi:hypothetical protein
MDKLIFYDFINDKYINTTYIINGTLLEYNQVLIDNNINIKENIFIHNFKIISTNTNISNINNIIILNKTYFDKNKFKSNNNNSNSFVYDTETDTHLSLLQENPDLISFIIILKTENLDYITTYLEKYKKKSTFKLIKDNQQNIVDILTHHNNFLDLYIRTSNINILEYIINYSNNNFIINQLEIIFPDVPVENIEELINIFS